MRIGAGPAAPPEKTITEEDVRVLVIDDYKYSCRALWQPQAQTDPIVLVSGAFQDMRSFTRIENRLHTVATVVTLDLPGSGGADPLPAEYGYDFLADALRAALDKLGIARANFVGISYSCAIAYQTALRYPERVAKLILSGAASRVPPWSRPRMQDAVALLRQGRYDEYAETVIQSLVCTQSDIRIRNRETAKRVLRGTVAGLTAETAASYADGIERLLASPSPYTLGSLTGIPALIITGEHDPYCTPELAREVAACIPGSAIALFKDADHMINIECEADLADVLIRFFSGRSLESLGYCVQEEPALAG